MERQGRASFLLRCIFTFLCTLLFSIQQGAVDPAGFRQSTHSAAVGEHKSVGLRDGSSMQLNTRTLATMEIDTRSRTATIHHGEALLKIAADPRPFVVRAGQIDFKTTEAAWAHFRLDPDGATRVDLLEGEGWVLSASATNGSGATAHPKQSIRSTFQPLRIRAGSSFSLRDDVRIVGQFDPGEMTRKLAWTHGQIALAGEPLREAIAEFNRYNGTQLIIGDESIANLSTGGMFYATEPDTFIRALSQLFGIHAVRMPIGAHDVVMLVGDGYSGL